MESVAVELKYSPKPGEIDNLAGATQTDANFMAHEAKIAELKRRVGLLKTVLYSDLPNDPSFLSRVQALETRMDDFDQRGYPSWVSDIRNRVTKLEEAGFGIAGKEGVLMRLDQLENERGIFYSTTERAEYIRKVRREERQRAAGIVEQAFIKSPSPNWWTLNKAILNGDEVPE